MSVTLVTMDSHLSGAACRAQARLGREMPGLVLSVHAAADWASDTRALERCRSDIASADIVIVSMLFMEEHFQPVLPALRERRDQCDAMVCIMSAGEVMKLTRMGRFDLSAGTSGPLALLRRLRGAKKPGEAKPPAAGAAQMAMLRRLPKLLRFIPGSAQDLRSYFLTMQYWLSGSEENVIGLVLQLIQRHADGPRKPLRARARPEAPRDYPDTGLYHPGLEGKVTASLDQLPAVASQGDKGCVGLLLLRSYPLAGNAQHYDGVIDALQRRGLRVIPAFATGLDARPAIEQFFFADGKPIVDLVLSLTGFSLVGGPAYNDARAAEDILARLDVPYIGAMPVPFQTLEQWRECDRGLSPVESTMMVAIPELDGAIGSAVYGGRAAGSTASTPDMRVDAERADMLAARVARRIEQRRVQRSERRVAIVLFNFPPNAGAVGTAAFLSVFESLHATLVAMRDRGYTVEVPPDVDALRDRILGGNASRLGAMANVHVRIPVDRHVRDERWLREIEAQWGPAPGKQQTDGATLHVLGERFGNVFVGLQPAFGYEGDPMRLLFQKGMAPTHAFSAFYRWIRDTFGAHVVLHFGTHGALEFMPGKQAGLSANCWPDRLIGDLPNLYLYASNNPSEGALAKRRGGATLISYLTPSLEQSGLYRGLLDLNSSIQRWRSLEPGHDGEREPLALLIQAQAAEVELASLEPPWGEDADRQILQLQTRLLEIEYTLIPHGLHVVGRAPSPAERIDTLCAMNAESPDVLPRTIIEALVAGRLDAAQRQLLSDGQRAAIERLEFVNGHLIADHEIDGLMRALDGRYIRPAPGGDLLRTPEVLPAGRNLHGFDPFRIPSAFAVKDGERQALRLLQRYRDDQPDDANAWPETIAMVLWGTDNLKSEGGPIGQALALMGARPRFDGYGRLAAAELIPLESLGRPRIDVVITLSGIFRDLLPLQIRLLAEAAWLAASADEPEETNFVRKHALAWQREHGGDLETAALRLFSNAEGAYGSNVGNLVDSSRWEDEDELAETFSRRKGFAYGRTGRASAQPELLKNVLSQVQLAYQNLDSVEVGVTTIDTYFDTLGGVSRAVKRARGEAVTVYIGDQTRGSGVVRTLNEQVALETRSRMLNPRWYEGLLEHGYEGVRQIEVHVTNTLGWSATTGQVSPWIYQQIASTFVLDDEMRDRLAKLNPTAAARVANRLLEASDRRYWTPDASMLEALRNAGEELEDRLEGVYEKAAA